MKTRTATALFIGLLLLAGVCNALQRSQEPLFETVLFCVNFLIYAGLLLFPLIGRAEGNVTVTDCKLQEMSLSVLTREGGNPLFSAAGGIVGWCGGDLTVSGIVLPKGTNAEIDSEGRDTWFGGLCGFCAGSSEIRNAEAHIEMSSYFYHGFTLCQSNILGYAQGAAAFSGVKTDCGENGNQTVTGDAESVYYLAALAGCAEGQVTAEGCEVNVHYNAYTGSAVLHDGSDGEGLYNTLH